MEEEEEEEEEEDGVICLAYLNSAKSSL